MSAKGRPQARIAPERGCAEGSPGAPRFFVDRPIAPAQPGDVVPLPDDVVHHAVRVRRLSTGDELVLFDGHGGEYAATLTRVDRREASAMLHRFDAVDRESPLDLTLVLSVLATDAMDYAVRKSVELGVRRIAVVVTERTQQSLAGERGGKRLAHWQSIAIAACEQCGRNRVPAIAPPVSLAEWMLDIDARQPVAIAGPGANESLAALARRNAPRCMLIGPEGGFSDAEMQRAVALGASPVHLGPRVLRAETAAVAALAILNAIAGDAR